MTTSPFRTLDDLDDRERVLVRLDLNSPVEDGEVKDNHRFDRHAETVAELADRRLAVVLAAHQGRPGQDDFVSLEQHAEILAEHVDRPVEFVPDTFGDDALAAVRDLDPGEVLLLENTRMCDEELPEEDPSVKADTEFVRALAPEFDAYVNDAYSAAHRAHASLVGFPLVLDAYAGRVMEAEYEANTAIAQREFDGDVTMVAGGAKATDVIDVMTALGDRVDDFLLGGVAGELFLRADGYPVGHDVGDTDRYDDQWAENRTNIEHLLDERREHVELPLDLAFESDEAVADDGTASGKPERDEIEVADVEEKDRSFLDVGSNTVEEYAAFIEQSEAVFVKGAMGVFEDERFADGTVGVLEAIADSDAFSVVGGGDTSRAIELYGMDEDDFSHVSIAGGAYIRALTGEELVAVEVLRRED